MPDKGEAVRKQLTRRYFLYGSSCVLLSSLISESVLGAYARSVAYNGQVIDKLLLNNFYYISNILTGRHQIEKIVSDQAYAALCDKYKDFPRRFNILNQAIRNAGVNDVEDFLGSALSKDELLHRTAVDIISAWYLGKVGQVKGESQVGGPAYVTYFDALLWRPTLNPGIIPSYSHGMPGWWGGAFGY